MKLQKEFLLTACLVILAACAVPRKIVLDPIGPRDQGKSSESTGVLIVYSAWERLNFGDPDHAHHTPYRLYGGDGKLPGIISNYRGGPVEEPTPIALPPGTYRLTAEGPRGMQVSVPITIRPGQTTSVWPQEFSQKRAALTETG